MDDDLVDRKTVRRMLSGAFAEVSILEACGGAEAFQIAIDEPDFAIFDYRLPGRSGLEVMTEFLEKWPNLTCVVMTGDGDEEIAKSAIKLGAFDYIQKNKLSEGALKRILSHGIERSRMNRQLESQKAELEIFSDVLIHDLKAPIRTIRFLSDQVKQDMDDGDDTSVRKGFELLARSAQQMGSLIDSLASHIHLNKEAEFERASLRQILEAASAALGPEIARNNVKINLNCPDWTIDCCGPQLIQLFQNLFANSIKYRGDPDPMITVTVDVPAEDRVLISVADNGAGVPEEFLERIFEPFKRAPSRAGVSGTGLGLATCRKVAERHGGSIICLSEVGIGSTFKVEFSTIKRTC